MPALFKFTFLILWNYHTVTGKLVKRRQSAADLGDVLQRAELVRVKIDFFSFSQPLWDHLHLRRVPHLNIPIKAVEWTVELSKYQFSRCLFSITDVCLTVHFNLLYQSYSVRFVLSSIFCFLSCFSAAHVMRLMHRFGFWQFLFHEKLF